MAIYRTSDGLSSCDPNLYSSLYDVNSRPPMKPETSMTTADALPKDTIEISRDKMKKEALNRLNHTSKQTVAQSGFMRIGRYLFFAVTLPPYFIVYGLPKWILVEGLPAIWSMFTGMAKQLQQKVTKRTHVVTQKVTQMMQFVQQTMLKLIQPIVRLAMDMQQGIRRMNQRVQLFFQQTTKRAKALLALPGVKVKEGWQQVQVRLARVKEKAFEKMRTISTQIQEGVQWIKETPQVLLGWIQSPFQQLTERAVSWKARVARRWNTSQQGALKATNWMAERMKQGQAKVKSYFEPLRTFYRNYAQPAWKKMSQAIQRKWQRTRDFSRRKHQKALSFLQHKQDKLKKFSYSQLTDFLLSNALMKSLPRRLQESIKKWLLHRHVRFLMEKCVRGVSGAMAYGLRGISYLVELFAKLTQIIGKFFSFLQVYLKAAGQKIVAIFGVGQKACRYVVLKGVYYVFLSTIVVGILMGWGIQGLKEMTHRLITRFAPKTS